MSKSNPMHFYLESKFEKKKRTFVRRTSFAGIAREGRLLIATAIWSNDRKKEKRDVYDKPLGRKIAEGRAAKNPEIVINLTDSQYDGRRVSDIFVEVCKNHTISLKKDIV